LRALGPQALRPHGGDAVRGHCGSTLRDGDSGAFKAGKLVFTLVECAQTGVPK
jgi:hypothetical protein